MTTTPSSAVVDSSVVLKTAAAKLPLMTLVIAMVAAMLIAGAGLGGALVYLVRSGRLPVQRGGAEEQRVAAPVAPPASRTMVLEPMVANLADAGGAAYLKITLSLRVAEETAKKGAPAKEEKAAKGTGEVDAAVRDTVLTVIGAQTAETLLAPEGKERLKSQLKAALAMHNPELKVMDVYFIDFLVQR